MKTKEYALDQIKDLAKELLPVIKKYSIIALYGPLGIGKTTLVKELLKQQGVNESVTSPTFGYVNTYANDYGDKFNHFDLYRITALEQFIDAGFDEYLTRAHTTSYVEWPEVIAPLLEGRFLSDHVARISLRYDLDDISKRIIMCDRWE